MKVKSKNNNPALLGGHAPGYLREIFCYPWEEFGIQEQMRSQWYDRLVDDIADNVYDEDQQKWWKILSTLERGKWITGQLWNCTDIMPGTLCDDLELPRGSSYAKGARKLRSQI